MVKYIDYLAGRQSGLYAQLLVPILRIHIKITYSIFALRKCGERGLE
jgi:hypothetical protein